MVVVISSLPRLNLVILPELSVTRLKITVTQVKRLVTGRVIELASPKVTPLSPPLVQVEVLEVQGPCNLQIQPHCMPRLREVVVRPVSPPEGSMCTFKRDREAAHRPGRCLVASKDLFNNAVFNSNDWYMGAIAFNKVALPQVAMCNSLEAWMVEVKEALYSAYQEEGGVAVC